ncbi:hypothetical protein [Streptomyces sp. NPDC059894]|uniref:SbtR family transcriptional regulator n=1 Tax=unclassified Streptomyces TaxID=2593676 RepID=UPI003649809D
MIRETLVPSGAHLAATHLMRIGRLPAADASMTARLDQLGGLLTAAQRTGRVRADITAQELRVMIGGVAQQLVLDGVTDPTVHRRHAALIVDTLRSADA